MIQLSILKITEYGPWTLTLGSEGIQPDLVQFELIKSLVENYSPKKKLFSIFGKTTKSNSFNNGFYVWGDVGRGKNDYKELFKVTLTISIGFGNTPFEANLKAYDGKQNNIILNQEHNIFGFIDST